MNHLTSEQLERIETMREMIFNVPPAVRDNLLALRDVDPLAAVRERAMSPGLLATVKARHLRKGGLHRGQAKRINKLHRS